MVVHATMASSMLMRRCAPGEMCLRITSPGRDPQVARLAAPKCTIGSARGCTLRLRARGIRPIECLILRTSQAAAVRAWAPGVRLNGAELGDARLDVGDTLVIGPVELEVLAIGSDPASSSVPESN
jgi:hypothetical protein